VPARLFGQGPNDPSQPELLALRLFLHGATLHSFSADYDADKVADAVQWLIGQLTPPPELPAVLARIAALQAQQASRQPA